MLIKINDKNEIIEYADVGGMDGAQEFKGIRPDDFVESFKPSHYLLQNNEIAVNPNYEEPIVKIPEPEPAKAQQQLAALAYQQMTTQQTITDLQTQNAQMAYQLMTAQGGATA